MTSSVVIDRMNPELARAHRADPEYFEYTPRDAIIYALGIGASATDDYRYIYEGADDFIPLPTFIVAPGFAGAGEMGWPGVDFDLTRILHGEHYIEVYKPLPTEAKLRSERQVVDILDKGKGALILSNITSYDESTGEKVAMQQFATFQVGSGGFGGNRTSKDEFPGAKIPGRQPDKVIEQKTSLDQAALYRQGSGDYNPLHVDPSFAQMSGFKQPILHGLCTLGFSTRHVLQAFADNDASKFRAIKVRFSSPVLPGQTLRTEMWKESDKIVFQTKVAETGKVVISNSWVRLEGMQAGGAPAAAKGIMSELKSSALFQQIQSELPNNKDAVKKVKAIVVYELTKGGKVAGKYTLDLKSATPSCYEGAPANGEKATVTVTVDDEDFVNIASGKMDATKAFMSGKLKAKGNVMVLQKLQGLLKGAGKAKI